MEDVGIKSKIDDDQLVHGERFYVQILCGHWFWAVEKISWLHDGKTIGCFRMSKIKWRREEWVQV